MTKNETNKEVKEELNNIYGKRLLITKTELDKSIRKYVSDVYHSGKTYADTDSIKYSEKDKEKDISIVQNFLDKVEKRLKQKEY